jgi:DNA recombination protein RmuC
VVNLPEGRKIVIDAKVSLVAYERYASAEDEDVRKVQLKAHVAAVRQHVKDLGSKAYDRLYGISSPDFVLMFVPIEPALAAALLGDDALYTDAFDRGVVLVTPSTLLATLRTVERIWKQEYQNRHVLEIAKQSGLLYDKFVNFVKDLDNVGTHLDRARDAHKDSMNKLGTGQGNLIRKAEHIRKLGARTRKKLDEALVEKALDGEEAEAVESAPGTLFGGEPSSDNSTSGGPTSDASEATMD